VIGKGATSNTPHESVKRVIELIGDKNSTQEVISLNFPSELVIASSFVAVYSSTANWSIFQTQQTLVCIYMSFYE
jgi:uncharacterized membrane protein